ncbi:hypothetical protein [Phormidesmis priestleyi]
MELVIYGTVTAAQRSPGRLSVNDSAQKTDKRPNSQVIKEQTAWN